jgi:large-conductance mechanosensitive channel
VVHPERRDRYVDPSSRVFLLVRSFNKMKKEEEETPKPPAAPPQEQVLLEEIRDLLKAGR